jgi:hypothetical protein
MTRHRVSQTRTKTRFLSRLLNVVLKRGCDLVLYFSLETGVSCGFLRETRSLVLRRVNRIPTSIAQHGAECANMEILLYTSAWDGKLGKCVAFERLDASFPLFSSKKNKNREIV